MRVSRLLVDELRRHALTAGINSIASTTTGPVSKTIVEGDALCSASGAVAVLLTCHRFRVMALEIAAVNATLLAIFVAAYVAFQLIGREERGRLRVGVLNAANKMQDENEHWQLRVTL